MPHFHNYCSFIIKIWKSVEYILHIYFSKLLVILGLLISIYILDSAYQFLLKKYGWDRIESIFQFGEN